MEIVEYSDLISNIRKKKITSNLVKIEEAYELARNAHKGTFRLTGEPFIHHPLAVALILSNLGLDGDSIIAALLHDVVEDSDVTLPEIEEKFGKTVSNIVDGVTKIKTIAHKSSDSKNQNFENLRKLLISSSGDIRIIILKIADRLHNMRTIGVKTEEEQIKYAKDTMMVYSPISEYLGMGAMKAELDDICFGILNPEESLMINECFKSHTEYNAQFIKKTELQIFHDLKRAGIRSKVFGRRKNLYSIYNKILKRNGYFDVEYISRLSDLWAFTVLVDTKEACYRSLGVIHTTYNYERDKFDDYIASPKKNGFKAIQTTVSIDNKPVEIQIKTHRMHEYNEYGPASHIAYKIKGNGDSGTDKFAWIKNLMEWNKRDILLDQDLIFNRIFVCTPEGLVKELDKDSTPVDFAYTIHTHIGNAMNGAKINGKLSPIDTKLQTGDIIEIIVDNKRKYPKRDWLNYAKMSQTRNVIRKWLRIEDEEKKLNEQNKNLEIGKVHDQNIKFKKHNDQSKDIVIIKGASNVPYKFAKCCNPIPPDHITGCVSLSGLIMIHKSSCKNIDLGISDDKHRYVDVIWNNKDACITTSLFVESSNKASIDNILNIILKKQITIENFNTKSLDDHFETVIDINVSTKNQLNDIIITLQDIKGVNKVKRQ